MFLIDTHVHSSRYSPCAEFLDLENLKRGFRLGLSGMVITDHDSWWTIQEWAQLQKKVQLLHLYRGAEISTSDGCHLVVIGIPDLGPLSKRPSSQDVIDFCHDQEGAVILAHPFQLTMPKPEILKQMDAIEVISSSFSKEETRLALELSRKYRKPSIGCSDAHAESMIGIYATAFQLEPEDEIHLARLIRLGQCQARLEGLYHVD